MILTPLQNFKGFDLDTWLSDNKDRTDETGLLVLLPTKRRQRDFKKFLATNYPGLILKTDTIRDLAKKTGAKLDPGFRSIPDEIHEVFIRQIINDLNDPNFSQNLTKGLIQLIKNTISEFKENGTSADALLLEINNLNPVNKEKAAFLARVFSALDLKLKSSYMKEIGDIYLLIQANASAIPKAFSEIYPEVNQVFMQNFMELSSPEIVLVEGIATQVKNRVYIDFDYSTKNRFLFEKLEKCFASLEKAGFRGQISTKEDTSPDFHTHIKNHLFNPVKPAPVKTDTIFEIEASTIYDELNFVAKEIKSLLLADKTLLTSDICLLFHRISGFTPYVRAAFDSCGIPTNITDRYKTSDFAPVSSLIDLLKVFTHNFSFNSVFRVLSNPVLRKRYGDPGHFKKGCKFIKVGSGHDKMVKLFTAAIKDFESQDHSTDESDENANLTHLQESLKTIKKLWSDLSPLNQEMSPAEFFSSLRKLIKDTGLLTGSVADTNGTALYNVRAFSAFLNSASFLFDVLEQYENNNRSFEEYLELVIELAHETRFNLVEQPETGVMITTPDEVRGLKFKHLFICAMNEGDFPTRHRAEIFKYDGISEQIKKHSAEERLLFYQALSVWKAQKDGKLYLTNSKRSTKKENVESYFKRDIKSLFTVTPVPLDKYKTKIYSSRDVFTSWGLFDATTAKSTIKTALPEGGLTPQEIEMRGINYIVQCNLDQEDRNSPFSGNIRFDETEETPLSLPVLRRVNHPFSATALESYAKCPYQFFTKYILKTDSEQEISEELDALEFGSLLHSILKTFHSELHEEGRSVVNCSTEEFHEYLNRMMEIAKDYENHKLTELLDTESFLSAEKILGIAGNTEWSIFFKYLETAQKGTDGLRPAFFENNFEGLKFTGLNSEERKTPYEIKLSGRIDRIDVDEQKKVFKVIDYKSGNKDYSETEVRKGSQLQLPLYLIAAEKGKVKGLPDEHLYLFPQLFSLKYNKSDFGPKNIHFSRVKVADTHENAKARWEELLTLTEENIQNSVLNILEGKFNLTTDPKRDSDSCKFCNFQSLCRVKEHKI